MVRLYISRIHRLCADGRVGRSGYTGFRYIQYILRLPPSQGAYGEQSFRGCPTAPAASARITEPEVSAYDENPSGKKQGQPCRLNFSDTSGRGGDTSELSRNSTEVLLAPPRKPASMFEFLTPFPAQWRAYFASHSENRLLEIDHCYLGWIRRIENYLSRHRVPLLLKSRCSPPQALCQKCAKYW